MKESTDIWFIAFLVHKGHQISSYSVIGKGKVRCSFNIDDESWKTLKLEFNNSEISKYKQIIESIKDLAY